MLPSADELFYFTELCQTLNFSRASERIGISQPSLSTAIKRLETTIGTSLFSRNKNGVALTPAGKKLLTHTKQLLELWETTKSKSLASHHEVCGNISLGCYPSVGLYFLPKFLPTLLNQYPNLEVRLKHDLSRKILEGVINLSIDVGLVVNPVKHPDLILQKIADDTITFWKSTEHTLVDHSLLICHPELIQTQRLLKKLHKAKKDYRIITSSNLEIVKSLVAAGAGLGILPGSVALSSCIGQLKPVEKMPSYSDEIYLVYRHENRDIKAIRTLVDAIKNQFKNNKIKLY